MRLRKNNNKVLDSFSMSGMTDVVFQLLIFFMLTSTLVAPNALKLLMPKKGRPQVQMESTVPTVKIDRNARITLDGRTVRLEDLAARLEARLADAAEKEVKFITDPEATIESVVEVMNIAEDRDYTVVLTQF